MDSSQRAIVRLRDGASPPSPSAWWQSIDGLSTAVVSRPASTSLAEVSPGIEGMLSLPVDGLLPDATVAAKTVDLHRLLQARGEVNPPVQGHRFSLARSLHFGAEKLVP